MPAREMGVVLLLVKSMEFGNSLVSFPGALAVVSLMFRGCIFL